LSDSISLYYERVLFWRLIISNPVSRRPKARMCTQCCSEYVSLIAWRSWRSWLAQHKSRIYSSVLRTPDSLSHS